MAPKSRVRSLLSSTSTLDSTPPQSDATSSEDTDTEATDGSSTFSKKRKRRKPRHVVWKHCRKPIQGYERYRTLKSEGGRRIWYCPFASYDDYSVLSTQAATNHLLNQHNISVDSTPSKVITEIQQDLVSVFGQQAIKEKEKES